MRSGDTSSNPRYARRAIRKISDCVFVLSFGTPIVSVQHARKAHGVELLSRAEKIGVFFSLSQDWTHAGSMRSSVDTQLRARGGDFRKVVKVWICERGDHVGAFANPSSDGTDFHSHPGGASSNGCFNLSRNVCRGTRQTMNVP
jgi:hypothetical protein